jgi:transcriptional regulator with XRE-family HTH domain
MVAMSVLDKVMELYGDYCNRVLPVGELIQQLRKARGYSQQALADRLNRGSTWISDAENGHLPRSTRIQDIEAIAHALNCHTIDKARLIDAYICYLLKHLGE